MIDKKELLKKMIDADITQRKLALLMDKSVTTINKWVNGESSPSIAEVRKICEILKITDEKDIAKIFLS